MQDTMTVVREAGIPFGSYLLLKRLARGGMAEVFLASQRGPGGFERRVALKRILPHLVDTPDFVRMFLDEARLAAKLTHPNIVHIYEFGQVEEHYFIAMEYVDGVHAGDMIERGAREKVPVALAARIGADACAGLNYAHHVTDNDNRPLHLVHRDISPPNLMISFDGVIKLVDFGIAKAVSTMEKTQPGIVKGKYAYMSPEQTMGEKLDGRSDVFSLALVLWELLAGRVALDRSDPVAAMTAIRDGQLPSIREARPDVPNELATVLERALDVDPRTRPPAAKVGNAFEGFIKSSPEMGTSMQLSEWIRTRFRRAGTEPEVPPATIPGNLKAPEYAHLVSGKDKGRGKNRDRSTARAGSKSEANQPSRSRTQSQHGRSRFPGPPNTLDVHLGSEPKNRARRPIQETDDDATAIESSSRFVPEVDEEAPTQIVPPSSDKSSPATLLRGPRSQRSTRPPPAGQNPAPAPAVPAQTQAAPGAPAHRSAVQPAPLSPPEGAPGLPAPGQAPGAVHGQRGQHPVMPGGHGQAPPGPSPSPAGPLSPHPGMPSYPMPQPPMQHPGSYSYVAPMAESDKRLWIAAIVVAFLTALIALAFLLDDEPGVNSDAGPATPGATSTPPGDGAE